MVMFNAIYTVTLNMKNSFWQIYPITDDAHPLPQTATGPAGNTFDNIRKYVSPITSVSGINDDNSSRGCTYRDFINVANIPQLDKMINTEFNRACR